MAHKIISRTVNFFIPLIRFYYCSTLSPMYNFDNDNNYLSTEAICEFCYLFIRVNVFSLHNVLNGKCHFSFWRR